MALRRTGFACVQPPGMPQRDLRAVKELDLERTGLRVGSNGQGDEEVIGVLNLADAGDRYARDAPVAA
jgi:hypothetical protein